MAKILVPINQRGESINNGPNRTKIHSDESISSAKQSPKPKREHKLESQSQPQHRLQLQLQRIKLPSFSNLPPLPLLILSLFLLLGFLCTAYGLFFLKATPKTWIKNAKKTGSLGRNIWRVYDSDFDLAVDTAVDFNARGCLIYFDSDREECTECRRIDLEFDELADSFAGVANGPEMGTKTGSESGSIGYNECLIKIDALNNWITPMRFGIRGLPSIVYLHQDGTFHRYDMGLQPTSSDLKHFVQKRESNGGSNNTNNINSTNQFISIDEIETLQPYPAYLQQIYIQLNVPDMRDPLIGRCLLLMFCVVQFTQWWKSKTQSEQNCDNNNDVDHVSGVDGDLWDETEKDK